MHKPFDTPDDTLEVIVYEVGDISKCVHHARNFPDLKVGLTAEMKLAIADTLAQLMVLAEWYGIAFSEVQQLVMPRFRESLNERFPLEHKHDDKV